MPTYDHRCECGEEVSEVRPMAQWDRKPNCPRCGKPMPQTFRTQAVRGDYKKPIELESMGFVATPEDVADHRRRHPGVDLVMRDGSAIPVIRSLGQKREYFKKENLADVRSFC